MVRKSLDILHVAQLVIAIITVLSLGLGGLKFILATEFIANAEASKFAQKEDMNGRLDSVETKLDNIDRRLDQLFLELKRSK